MPTEPTTTIAYRVTTSMRGKLEAALATFTRPNWREFHEWLYDQPEVQNVIAEKIRGER